MKLKHIGYIAVGVVVAAVVLDETNQPSAPAPPPPIETAGLTPDWGAIAGWPSLDEDGAGAAEAAARPDPQRLTTLIVLDDSGSMKSQMSAAKEAVIEAAGQLPPDSRVGVIALNAGMVTPVVDAREAARTLPADLERIPADGTTPLGDALTRASALLTTEARRNRGFGVFRIVVTTDGEASDQKRLDRAVTRILSSTPIEIATIGIGIGEGHALNVPGFTDYVNVDAVSDLAAALKAASAEQTVFDPITSFEE